MKTERLANEIDRAEVKGGHVEALLKALGNPSEWQFTGEVVDDPTQQSKCACGHPIRWCFVIRHQERGQTHVGSTCIDQIALITPELGRSLTDARQALQERLKEAKARARQAAAEAENQRLWSLYAEGRDQLLKWFTEQNQRGGRASYSLWFFCRSHKEQFRRMSPPEYQRPSGLTAWLKRAIKRVEQLQALTKERPSE